MKLLTLLCLAASLCLLAACRNHAQPSDPSAGPDTTQKKDSSHGSFLPVAYFLMSEIRQVDTTPLALYKYTSQTRQPKNTGRSNVPGPSDTSPMDSVLISVPEFNILARHFLLDELDPDRFEKNYTESSFEDKTTQSITFTYSPLDNSATLQRVDVITEAFQGVSRIRSLYLQRTYKNADTLVTEKMYWRAQHYFQITTISQPASGQAIARQAKVVWDPIVSTD
jgi:hypothetical protein